MDEKEDIYSLFKTEIYNRISKVEKILSEFNVEGDGEKERTYLQLLLLEFHSIKGAADIAGIADIIRISQVMCDLLRLAQQEKIKLTGDNIITFNRVTDIFRSIVDAFLKGMKEINIDYFDLLMQLKKIKEESKC